MDQLAELLGESPGIEEVRGIVRRLLGRQRVGQRLPSILLQGETGTGKGLVARLLHRHGVRSRAPFVDVNCAAIPEALLEAELFGFERGAFTDARRAKPGLFQAAEGGVLFLDEVALLPGALQAKVLTAVEQRSVRRLGSTRPEPVDVWIVSAANTDLPAAVRAGLFREHLYHRLAVLTLTLPPLRERGRDILHLADRFLARACAEYDLPPKRLDAGAQHRLLGYSWPGNIRELGNVIERAALLADTAVVTAEGLGPLTASSDVGASPPATAGAAGRDDGQRQKLLRAMEETGWNVSHAAARLGVARNTVYTRLGKFGLRPDRPRPVAPDPSVPAKQAVMSPALDTGLRWEQQSIALMRAELSNSGQVNNWSLSTHALEEIIAKIDAFGGRVEELTPTGLVAAFGVDPAEDAARRAAHAALAIQTSVQRARDSDDAAPAIAIGLHVAPLLVGRVGTRVEIDAESKRGQWPALERALHAAEPGETVASRSAAPFLERRFELARLFVQTDGQDPVYRLTGREQRGLGLWGTMTRFVGRREELEFLRSRVPIAAGGRGQVIAVVGEAGVGKSRLIHELTAAQRLERWRILEGLAVSYGQVMSYLPVIQLRKEYFAVQDRDDPRRVREKVTGRVKALDPALQPMLPALLGLLDVPVDDAVWQRMDPSQRRQRTLDAVRRLLLRETRERPLLLIFEDLHWVDRETQALLDSLVDGLDSRRLLLVASYRPEYQHSWANKTGYSQLRLDVLPTGQAGEFLDALLGEDPSLAPLKHLLVKRGNPFFIEETVRTLVETQALDGERGAYRLVHAAHATRIPATVQVILAARIDRLGQKDKDLLQTAAVIGKDVPIAVLQAVAETDEAAMREGLARLRAAEFLYEVPLAREIEYTFKHALTHEVAYRGLPPPRCRELHARIVEAIESLHGDRLDEYIERLAHHALRGELREKAVHYLRRAGLRAAARSALQDARAWFEQALDVLGTLPESPSGLEEGFEIRLELRPVLSHLGEVRQMLGRLREAEALAERLDDDRRRGQVSALMIVTHALLGGLDEALATGGRALDIARRLEDWRLRVLTTTYLAQVHYYQCDYERSIELATDNLAGTSAEAGGERLGNSMRILIYARYWLILSLAECGRFAEAGWHRAEALRLTGSAHHLFSAALNLWAGSNLHLLKGDWPTARSLVEQGLATLRTGNITLSLPRVVAASAWVLALVGETDEAFARLDEGEQLLERDAVRGSSDRPGEVYHSLGRASLLLGRPDDAQRFGDRAVACSSRHRGFAAHARHLLGDIASHAERFDAERAEVHYREALALAEPRGMRPLVAHCHLGLGKVYQRTGRRERARHYVATAAAMYADMGMRFWLERAEEEMR